MDFTTQYIKRFAVAVLLGWAGITTGFATQVQPDHENVRYVGRFTDDYRFGWTGSLIEVVFTGSTISADLDVSDGHAAGLTVVVDGEAHFLKATKGRKTYEIATGLKAGEPHTVAIFKRSEGGIGEVQFFGFDISDDGKLLPAEVPTRKMLVVGDSITCGYGNEAKTIKEGNSIENENGYMAYAPIAARALDADLMMVCWSGRGMYRNRSEKNDLEGTLPQLFEQTLPKSEDIQWDHSRFVPDVVVINLGTNDMTDLNGKKSQLQKADFVGAYKSFIERVRSYAPKSKIIISIGPMGFDPVREWLPEIAAGFDGVTVLNYSPYTVPEDRGGNHHPSVKFGKEMAAELLTAIEEATGWTAEENGE